MSIHEQRPQTTSQSQPGAYLGHGSSDRPPSDPLEAPERQLMNNNNGDQLKGQIGRLAMLYNWIVETLSH